MTRRKNIFLHDVFFFSFEVRRADLVVISIRIVHPNSTIHRKLMIIIRPSHPIITMYILHTVLHTVPIALTRIISIKSISFSLYDHFRNLIVHPNSTIHRKLMIIIRPSHPIITMYILHTVLHTVPIALTRIISIKSISFSLYDHFRNPHEPNV